MVNAPRALAAADGDRTAEGILEHASFESRIDTGLSDGAGKIMSEDVHRTAPLAPTSKRPPLVMTARRKRGVNETQESGPWFMSPASVFAVH
jgi:hypothetical protein